MGYSEARYYKRLLLKLIFLFALSALLRLIFLLANYENFNSYRLSELVGCFVYGLLFDVVVISYFTGFFWAFSLFPWPWRYKKWYRISLIIYFVIAIFLISLLNLGDTAYFQYVKKRSGMEIWQMYADFFELLPEYIKQYILQLICSVTLFILITIRFIKSELRITYNYKPWTLWKFIIQLITFLTVCLFIILGARGGLYLKPIKASDASRFVNPGLIPVATSTPIQMIGTFESKFIKPDYLKHKIAEELVQPIKHYKPISNSRPNVVILILESFGKEYIGYYNEGKGHTPFLDSICKVSLTFPHSYANGLTSKEALPSILAGIPSIGANPFIYSNYQTNIIYSLGKLLSELNYNGSFYHGGKNGTMGFDVFVKLSEFGEYYGKNEYPDTNPDNFEKWGVFDEAYLQYFCNEISKKQQPFITGLFTLSSHNPFQLPKKYEGSFKEGSLPIHKTIEYTDFSLKQFFKSASKTPWFNNTLFVITADHTSTSENSKYQTVEGIFSVPIIFFMNGKILQADTARTVQQIDILPSILNYVGFQKPFFALGNSVFDSTSNSIAVQSLSGNYQAIKWPNYVQLGNANTKTYNIRIDPNCTIPTASDSVLEKKLKAVLQVFFDRMNTNTFYFK